MMSKLIVAGLVGAMVMSVEAGFWDAVGNVLTAAAQPKETVETVVKNDFSSQLKEIDSLSTKANSLVTDARSRFDALKARYTQFASTYGALFPTEKAKIDAKIAEGEGAVSRMTTTAENMAKKSVEASSLEPIDANLAQVQSIARLMAEDFAMLQGEDRSVSTLVSFALMQIAAVMQGAEK